jgi:hypothetical protein
MVVANKGGASVLGVAKTGATLRKLDFAVTIY